MSYRNIYIFIAATAACVLAGVQLTSLNVPGTWPVFAGGVVFLALLAGYFWLADRRPVLTERILLSAAVLMALSYSFAAYRAASHPELFFNAARAFEGAMTLVIVAWFLVALFPLSYLWRKTPHQERRNSAV